MGKEIYFDDEEYLDMVTAISGSGPAYLYLFAESLIEAGGGAGAEEEMPRSWYYRRCSARRI